ncbi:PTS system mannose/fructose/sorbose family transporter subunit IID [Oscillospiraceae bacterium MB08-C2-2]|nr:PTS system mannose/fructose/sorbose family transporter subunit IID [Oscillospiraceae bacterium MB08-C2-2]
MAEKTLRKSDLVKHWLLGYSSETSYNYERLQALGNANSIQPIIKRLYSKEQYPEEISKYLVFFNTEPSFMGTVIHGITAAMEEKRANGEDISAEDINSVRLALMGPLAGMGDVVSQSIVYPVLAGICIQLALAGNYFGPLLFEFGYKIIMLTMGYNMYMLGYRKGRDAILDFLQGGILNRLIEVFSIIGLMVVGNMAVSRVAVRVPLEWVFTNELGQVNFAFQTGVLDALLPGLLPLAITMGVWTMLRKRVKPLTIVAILFAAGIVLSLLGLLAAA